MREAESPFEAAGGASASVEDIFDRLYWDNEAKSAYGRSKPRIGSN